LLHRSQRQVSSRLTADSNDEVVIPNAINQRNELF
jgi:hypothetical protein